MWVAGQAQAYTLPGIGQKKEEKETLFTIASVPSEGEIYTSTRISQSKFKQALNEMKPEDEIQAHGLEGEFTWVEESGDPVVLVAGGIGITPFRSILKSRQSAGKRLNSTLLYFNRDGAVAFQEELEAIRTESLEFRIEIVIGEKISADAIFKHAPQVEEQLVFLSGQEGVVEKVGSELRDLGVTIKQDWFPGYDEKTY